MDIFHKLKFERITKENFGINSLDSYNRYQETTECLRLTDGEHVYISESFVENWDEDGLRTRAKKVMELAEKGFIGFMATLEGKTVGFGYFGTETVGSRKQYIELQMLHTSYEYRGMGIGRKLFELLCDEARDIPVEKVYISAHPARETQSAYKKLGCVYATEVIADILALEPLDIQLEFVL